MKKIALIALAAAAALPLAAHAQDEGAKVSVYAAAGSDYIWRGVSQTLNKGAISGGVDVNAGAFYVGTWGGNVDFDTKAEFEWDIYASYKPTLGPVNLEFGVLAYTYPGESALNTTEFKVGGSYTSAAGVTFTLADYFTDHVGKGGPGSNYIEGGFSGPLPMKTGEITYSWAASYGKYSFDSNVVPDYDNWKFGVTANITSHIGLEVGYTDTNLSGVDVADGRAYGALKFSF